MASNKSHIPPYMGLATGSRSECTNSAGTPSAAGPSAAVIEPAFHSSQIEDFPFLGVCSHCRRIAWFRNPSTSSGAAPAAHECDQFASPYLIARRWDTLQSVDALQFNLLHLVIETNDALQAYLGREPPSVAYLPRLPALYWPMDLDAGLHPYIDQSADDTARAATADTTSLPWTVSTPVECTILLAICPQCGQVEWHSRSHGLGYHLERGEHDFTTFSTSAFAAQFPALNTDVRDNLIMYNHRFRNLAVEFPEPPPPCPGGRRLLSRVPCGQFTARGSEMWVVEDGEQRHCTVEWQTRVTALYTALLAARGASPHAQWHVPPASCPAADVVSSSLGPRRVWPMVEDPDVREIVGFRNQMQSFLLGRTGPLTASSPRPPWSPAWVSRRRMEAPYKVYPILTPHTSSWFSVIRCMQWRKKGVGPPKMYYIAPDSEFQPPKMISLTPGVWKIPLTPLYAEQVGLVLWREPLCMYTFLAGTTIYPVTRNIVPRTAHGSGQQASN